MSPTPSPASPAPSLRPFLYLPLYPPFFCLPANTPQTKGFCETTKNVKSYAGYVRLPAGSQYAPYEQNIFFWFFEARSKPKSAPLTVWVQGGPGMGSASQVSLPSSPYPLPRCPSHPLLSLSLLFHSLTPSLRFRHKQTPPAPCNHKQTRSEMQAS